MNWKSFLLGVSTGLAGAYIVRETVARKEMASAEEVLEQVKAAFKKEGPINGSWISMNAEPYFQLPIKYNVYKGGISRDLDGQSQLFEFIADAKTGTIIDTKQVNEKTC